MQAIRSKYYELHDMNVYRIKSKDDIDTTFL